MKFKLTKKQLDELVETEDDLLTARFPGYTRADLRVLKRTESVKRRNAQVSEKLKIRDVLKEVERKKNKKLERNEREMLLSEIDRLSKEKDAILTLVKTPQNLRIRNINKDGKLSAIPFIVASDWHVEETVTADSVNQLNEFNLKIADERINNFFKNSLKLLKIHSQEVKIDTVVFALLGDFISGNIHEELLETASLRPAEAIAWVMQRIDAGIKFFLDNTKYNFIIPCHVGNHTRITEKVHMATEAGNSLESIMYNFLATKYKNEKRLTFIIAEGYHTYLDLYGYTIRMHHGHAIKYGGGVGGIFIPTYKAISQWNRARTATLDIFGHYHQLKNGGNFISNGSLIGWSPYALRIKADFEKPRQKFFMFTSSGEVVAEHPIFL